MEGRLLRISGLKQVHSVSEWSTWIGVGVSNKDEYRCIMITNDRDKVNQVFVETGFSWVAVDKESQMFKDVTDYVSFKVKGDIISVVIKPFLY